MHEASRVTNESWAPEVCPAGETDGSEIATRVDTAQLGLMGVLATVTMLFAGFTSAYLVRRSGGDWEPVSLPGMLWLNTGLLLAGSVAVEIARARMQEGRDQALKLWLQISTVLGAGFVVGQVLAWRELVRRGVFLPTSPHSSFFYMLTGVHGLHVVGGILALLYALYRVSRAPFGPSPERAVKLSATYWHFVDGLWLYLFVLLSVG